MGNKHLLLVDDSRLARMMLRAMIQEHYPEWTIVEASSGEEAIKLLEHQNLDLALVDYNMPGLNGLELCLQIREKRPDMALHLVTANIQDKIRERAESNAIGFINKPVSKETLGMLA